MSSRTREVRPRPSGQSARALTRIGAAAVVASLSLTTLAVTTASGSPTNHDSHRLVPGNLLVSRSVYSDVSGLTAGAVLPPGCSTGCAVATTDGTYPYVFNNALADGSFGVTSPAYIDQLTPTGAHVSTITIPRKLRRHVAGLHRPVDPHGRARQHDHDPQRPDGRR
jgi:hypothetical protein